MKPSPWPDFLDGVKAKSEAYGGETLTEHTWDVLCRLADLRRLRPELALLVGQPNLWHYLFWACLLHDFGKATRGFQARLAGGPPWKHRHEVVSLAFLDWIAPGLSEDERHWIMAAIVSHHRDAAKILNEIYPDVDPDPLVTPLAELDAEVVSQLWRWIDECAAVWITTLGFAPDEVRMLPLLPQDEAVTLVVQQGTARVRYWLRDYADWLEELCKARNAQYVVFTTLLRGLTTSADHMASAHLKRMPDLVQEAWQQLAGRILGPGLSPYAHQAASAAASGSSALLIAPTGSGKTEAALYWALGDGIRAVIRLFYALPYQASMNAMYDRLRDPVRGFGDDAVGLQHGRALQALYARLIDQEYAPRTAAGMAGWEKNINKLNARPVKVFSPYQMLKALFQIRGFEAMLTDYAQAAFVFDEIHAYEPKRLALMLELVRYLREHYGARFFMMSATFPQLIRDKLAAALGEHALIKADDQVFKQFRRHKLHLLDGELTDPATIACIAGEVQAGKQVLVCANTVKRAQELRDLLTQAGLTPDQLLLIHSRYIFSDRNKRETDIRDLCGVDVLLDARKPLALIATQVVEVSLNIDLDTIYSDPAPLEALLQRFGRVNRSCRKGICPVYVFRLPNDGQGVYGRHNDKAQSGHIVRATLAELERHNDQEIDEAAINDWLNTIYADPQLQTEWESAYSNTALTAIGMLRDLRPFNSDPLKEEQFEEMFESVEVVPQRFEVDYVAKLIAGDFIEASNYLVSISTKKFHILKRKGLASKAEAEGKRGAWVVKLGYSDDEGLSFEPSDKDQDWGE